jgi:HTH-type transcriptional regulator / antitoxin HipB
MYIRTPADFGAAVRGARMAAGLSQQALAERAGVGRQWLVAVEAGKPRAGLSHLLRLVAALGLALELTPDHTVTGASRLDILIARHLGDG